MDVDNAQYRRPREQMIANQLRARDIKDTSVLEVMGRLPRERFVPEALSTEAYADRALPIGLGQTISQPYMVALMTEQLQVEAPHRVLEIGTGCGYQTAILARLATSVYTVERLGALSARAQKTLTALGIDNVRYKVADGTLGWPGPRPFARIIVTASSPKVPGALIDQLAEGGLLIIPTGSREDQTLMRFGKCGGKLTSKKLVACRFVKLLGKQGWPEEEDGQ